MRPHVLVPAVPLPVVLHSPRSDSKFPISRLYDQVDWTGKPISLVDLLYWRLMNQGPKGVRSPMDKMPDE